MKPILPGQTIGILGSGQLGRMLALAARRMGYRVHVFSPASGTPTGQVADREFSAEYQNLDAIRDFANSVDVVTYEFENVPADTAAACAEIVPLRPGAQALHVAQNRLREKQFLAGLGLPVAAFRPINKQSDLDNLVGDGWVLKSAESGYDGKGQAKFTDPSAAVAAWDSIGRCPAVLEAFVTFEREISVVAARGVDGSFAHYGAIANDHANHILDVSIAPAPVDPSVAQAAIDMASTILTNLDVVGVLCTEFFVTTDNKLYVNEIAPRPHNSGHLTIDACVTGQFEQQLRAICGLPLGSTAYHAPAAMANLLGELWQAGEPDWHALNAIPNAKLHLYAKEAARIGRKMGHVTVTGSDAETVVRKARKQLIDT